MSILPGLGLTAPTPEAQQPVPEARQIELPAGSEWRFEVSPGTNITLKVLSPSNGGLHGNAASGQVGTAEVFGTELAPNHQYEFPGLTKAAVYTHHGCTLSVTGSCESEYVAEETPMNEYVNLHFALENIRNEARASGRGGPRVLVVGPENAGKTSLVKTLAAYATRGGRNPLVVSLDPKEGMLCLPGSISAAVLGTGALLDVEDAAGGGWGSSPIGGPSAIPVKMPLMQHYGYANPDERSDMFKPVCTRLALAATSRYEGDAGVKEAGMIVDSAGSTSAGKGGYEVIQHIVSEFSINILLVIGSERLFSDLSRRFPSTGAQSSTRAPAIGDEAMHVLKLSKSGGCVDRDETYMRQRRQAQIRSYFFGNAKITLSPHTSMVDFSAVTIYRMVNPNAATLDFLPGGDEEVSSSSHKSAFEKVTPSMAMQNAILAIKHCNPLETPETIRDANVMGYVYIADVDESKKKIRVLAPVGGRLPNRAIVWGSWPEGVGDLVG